MEIKIFTIVFVIKANWLQELSCELLFKKQSFL